MTTIKISKGDPFFLTLSVKNETSNTNINLSSGWTIDLKLREKTQTGTILAGVGTSLATGNAVVSISSSMTETYPEGRAIILLKLSKNDNSIPPLRSKYDVNIVKEYI